MHQLKAKLALRGDLQCFEQGSVWVPEAGADEGCPFLFVLKVQEMAQLGQVAGPCCLCDCLRLSPGPLSVPVCGFLWPCYLMAVLNPSQRPGNEIWPHALT